MRKGLIALVVFLIAASVMVGCGGAPEKKAVIFKYPIGQDVPTLDPAHITDTTSSDVGRQMFEGLVCYDGQLNIIPQLAEKWDISEDGTTYTFHLKDVKFSNGDSLTADDFKWSFERVLLPNTKSERTWIFDEIVGYDDFKKGMSTEFTGVKVVDPLTLEVKILAPSGIFLHKMTYSAAWVVNKKVVEAYENPMELKDEEIAEGEKAEEKPVEEKKEETTTEGKKPGQWFEYEPVGTGAFKLVEWKRGQNLVMERNDDWWGYKDEKVVDGYDSITNIEFPIIQDDNVRMQEYKAGNLDWVQIPDADFPTVKEDPVLSMEMLSVEELSIYYIGFQNKLPPFDNVKVRQAFNYAVNRQDIIDKIFIGRHKLATGIIPPSMPNFKSKTDAYPYDPVMAKNLLDEAKKEGAVIPDKVTLAFNQGTVTHKNVAERIQSDLKANLDVNVVLETEDWTTYLKHLDNGEFPLFRLGWVADYPDPDNFLWVLLDSANAGPNGGASFYSNPAFDKLVRDAKTEKDTAKRMSMYEEAESFAMKDAVWMPIAFTTNWSLLKPWVTGYIRTPMGPLSFATIQIKAH